MSRPPRVQILGQPFSVDLYPGDSPLVADSASAQGTSSVVKQAISLEQGQGPEQERDTLLHEILHVIVKMTGHGTDFAIGAEEAVVYAIATALLGVLRSNPDLVAWLVESLP